MCENQEPIRRSLYLPHWVSFFFSSLPIGFLPHMFLLKHKNDILFVCNFLQLLFSMQFMVKPLHDWSNAWPNPWCLPKNCQRIFLQNWVGTWCMGTYIVPIHHVSTQNWSCRIVQVFTMNSAWDRAMLQLSSTKKFRWTFHLREWLLLRKMPLLSSHLRRLLLWQPRRELLSQTRCVFSKLEKYSENYGEKFSVFFILAFV